MLLLPLRESGRHPRSTRPSSCALHAGTSSRLKLGWRPPGAPIAPLPSSLLASAQRCQPTVAKTRRGIIQCRWKIWTQTLHKRTNQRAGNRQSQPSNWPLRCWRRRKSGWGTSKQPAPKASGKCSVTARADCNNSTEEVTTKPRMLRYKLFGMGG